MARSHVRLQFGMWRKDGHDETTKDARWLYVTILSDETLNQAGMVRLSIDLWADDAGMTAEETREALRELVDRRFVVVDRHELLVRTFIRNDGVADQPNVLRNALELARQIRSPTIRRALAVELRKLPPAPPPREITGKGGSKRMFVYPDPHAVADEIDPGGPPPSGLPVEGSAEPTGDPSLNPSNNPSDNPAETLPLGTLPTTLPGTPRGRGRGSSSSPVRNYSSSKNTHTRSTRARTSDAEPEGFADFWADYPRKVGKIKAKDAYRKAIDNGAEPADLISAVRRYARYVAANASADRYIAHPTTWLNEGRWDDELPEPSTGSLQLVVGGAAQPRPSGGTTSERVNAILALKKGNQP
jgi:hypothetical protein